MNGRRLFLNDSTPYTGPVFPVNNPLGFVVPGSSGGGACPPGQVNDFDPATGQYSALCVDDTLAYQYQGGSLGTVNVKAGPLDWTTIAIYGGIALLVLAIFTGGRRR